MKMYPRLHDGGGDFTQLGVDMSEPPKGQRMLDLINTEVKLSLVGIAVLISSVAGITWGMHSWISGQFEEAEKRQEINNDVLYQRLRELEKAVSENSSRLQVTNAILARIERQLGNGELVGFEPRRVDQ